MKKIHHLDRKENYEKGVDRNAGEHMNFQNRKRIHLFLGFVKLVAAFIIGSFTVHLIVMFLDYYLLTKPLFLNLRENFVDSIFSTAMIPMMGAYGLFSIVTYSMWARMRKAILLANAKEIQSEKVEEVLNCMQRITGILAEHIATHNSEIKNWVEFRKRNGRPVSEKIEKPCNKIANALHSLSEISFIFPYTENRPGDVTEIEKILQDKLSRRNAAGRAVRF